MRRTTLRSSVPCVFRILLTVAVTLLASCYTTPSALKSMGTVPFGQPMALSGKVTPLIVLPGVEFNLYLLSDAKASYPLVSKKKYANDEVVDFHGTVWNTQSLTGLPDPAVLEPFTRYLVSHAYVKQEVAQLVVTTLLTGLKGLSALADSLFLLVQE